MNILQNLTEVIFFILFMVFAYLWCVERHNFESEQHRNKELEKEIARLRSVCAYQDQINKKLEERLIKAGKEDE